MGHCRKLKKKEKIGMENVREMMIEIETVIEETVAAAEKIAIAETIAVRMTATDGMVAEGVVAVETVTMIVTEVEVEIEIMRVIGSVMIAVTAAEVGRKYSGNLCHSCGCSEL